MIRAQLASGFSGRSKYSALREYMENVPGLDLSLDFEKIPEIAGVPVGHSFLDL